MMVLTRHVYPRKMIGRIKITMSIATRTVQCRHGVFTYHSEDRLMGASLRIYGEWSEDEVKMYDVILKPSDVVIEVGANIGSLTIPLSRRCKKVYAFEPQPQTYELLSQNLSCNGIHNVDAFPYAIGAKDGVVNIPSLEEIDEAKGDYVGAEVGSGSYTVEQRSLDGFSIKEKISFIKMDCEGSELDTLIGSEKLIQCDWPLLYVENNRPTKSEALVGWLVEHGYQCYWHRPKLYSEDNFRNYIDNIFGNCDSINMICVNGHKNIDERWLLEKVK